jgi:hypothetical protein
VEGDEVNFFKVTPIWLYLRRKKKSATKKSVGLLFVVGFALISTSIKTILFLTNDLLPLFSGNNWKKLTTAGTNAYDPWIAPLLVFELIGNLILLLFFISLIIMFFQKYKWFPKLMLWALVFSAIFSMVDYFVGKSIPSIANQLDANLAQRVFANIFISILWILYLLNSERVKHTFINEKLNL